MGIPTERGQDFVWRVEKRTMKTYLKFDDGENWENVDYSQPKETEAAITILYRSTKVKLRSPDGDTEYFDIVAGVLQGDTLASYLFIICLDYVLRTSINKIRENGWRRNEAESTPQKQLPTPTMPMT